MLLKVLLSQIAAPPTKDHVGISDRGGQAVTRATQQPVKGAAKQQIYAGEQSRHRHGDDNGVPAQIFRLAGQPGTYRARHRRRHGAAQGTGGKHHHQHIQGIAQGQPGKGMGTQLPDKPHLRHHNAAADNAAADQKADHVRRRKAGQGGGDGAL